MRFACVLAACSLIACGRVGFQREGQVPDAGTDAGEPDAGRRDGGRLDGGRLDGGRRDGGHDAGPDGGHDGGPGVFDPPSLIGELNTASNETDPTLTGDELDIWFISDRGGNLDVWTASRAAATDPWSAPTHVTELANAAAETDPEVSPDGLHMFVSSNRGGNNDLWESTRASRAAAWSTPVRNADLSSTAQECCAVISDDGLRVLFATDRGPGGNSDIYRGSRASTSAAWSGLGEIFELDTSRSDSNPHWTPDELIVVFDSDRGGTVGMRDIFQATRATPDGVFDPPQILTELATASDERDAWISRDARRIWFSSNRSGNSDLFEAARR